MHIRSRKTGASIVIVGFEKEKKVKEINFASDKKILCKEII